MDFHCGATQANEIKATTRKNCSHPTKHEAQSGIRSYPPTAADRRRPPPTAADRRPPPTAADRRRPPGRPPDRPPFTPKTVLGEVNNFSKLYSVRLSKCFSKWKGIKNLRIGPENRKNQANNQNILINNPTHKSKMKCKS